MTEKRFQWYKDTVALNLKMPIMDNGKKLNIGEIFNELNKLNDENEQLKSDKELFAQCICNLSNLLCENKIEHNLPKNIEDFISVWGVRIE